MDLIACIEKAGRAGGREELLFRPTGGVPITSADIADLEPISASGYWRLLTASDHEFCRVVLPRLLQNLSSGTLRDG
jgi:hypothetical protein